MTCDTSIESINHFAPFIALLDGLNGHTQQHKPVLCTFCILHLEHDATTKDSQRIQRMVAIYQLYGTHMDVAWHESVLRNHPRVTSATSACDEKRDRDHSDHLYLASQLRPERDATLFSLERALGVTYPMLKAHAECSVKTS